MTTLIDRIMNNQKMIQIVNQLQTGDDDIIREILEAELTAVKGVDELIEKMKEIFISFHGTQAEERGAERMYNYIMSEIKSLKQTTLIDRIMNNQKMIQIVNQLQIGDDDIIRQILEAELTAVNGVDDVCTACYGKKGYSVFHQDNSKDDFTGKDLGKGKTWESLETCPRCNGTGEEPKKPEKPEIMLQPGQYMRDNEGNITTYEDEQKERLKDSQPKEVEIAKKCLQCGTHYNGGTIKFCSSDCCLKWNGMK